MDLKQIFSNGNPSEIFETLTNKTISFDRTWEDLRTEYEPELHRVMTDPRYKDRNLGNGVYEPVTRITYDYQKLAVNRMAELCFGIPVTRETNASKESEKELLGYMENIFRRSRIDSVNLERAKMLFAAQEVMTLWYAVEEETDIYGFHSKLKLRCKNFSPFAGDELYPLFDEYGDLVALSVKYKLKVLDQWIWYLDAYTQNEHIKLVDKDGGWKFVEREKITLGKIPAIYMHRPTPIWENTTHIVEEIEMTMSLTGNYLRKNSKPIFAVFSGDRCDFGNEKSPSEEDRVIFQFPVDAKANYITWQQSVDSLKFYIDELRQSFFTQLQIPDWSYESMKSTPMSGESRKQLFVDAMLKVKEESGRLCEFLDREVNVVKAFMKLMMPGKAKDIDALQVNSVITPYTVTDEVDTIKNATTANGGLPVLSHEESIAYAGLSSDPHATFLKIQKENAQSSSEMTI